jgi:hypothetical protein
MAGFAAPSQRPGTLHPVPDPALQVSKGRAISMPEKAAVPLVYKGPDDPFKMYNDLKIDKPKPSELHLRLVSTDARLAKL